jgi:hypothetical protein
MEELICYKIYITQSSVQNIGLVGDRSAPCCVRFLELEKGLHDFKARQGNMTVYKSVRNAVPSGFLVIICMF